MLVKTPKNLINSLSLAGPLLNLPKWYNFHITLIR